MSELQNRIVERLGALDPLRQVALTPDKRERLMTAAIGLFYAAGGDADDLKEIVLKADDGPSALLGHRYTVGMSARS